MAVSSVSIVSKNTDLVTLQISIPLSRSMLDSEKIIQCGLNEAGAVVTQVLLETFDTDGAPIKVGGTKLTSMGLEPKYYETPYGTVQVARHLYQSNQGGATYCPLERDARIVSSSTPRFAAQISHKMAGMAAAEVQRDLEVNHERHVSKFLVQRLSETVATVVQAKEESWNYYVPEVAAPIKTVSIGLDGTCMLMSEDGYRQAMVGTIALYDATGERQHTTYVAASPEYGKAEFRTRLTREISRTKTLYPEAYYIGLADGAHDNWEFLEQHTQKQTLDFYHATEYVTKVADSVFSSAKGRDEWLEKSCHELKHTAGFAKNLLEEMECFRNQKLGEKQKELLEASITYFRNNCREKCRMDYAESVAINRPIGSGVTEAACKVIVKQRLCKSGMKWKEKGARAVLSLRTLVCSSGAWGKFWQKINQYGVPSLA